MSGGPRRGATLYRDLTALLNTYSVEGKSNTCDYVLADYMLDCLAAYEKATRLREQWHLGTASEADQ